jgi:uncharacterized membrane protein
MGGNNERVWHGIAICAGMIVYAIVTTAVGIPILAAFMLGLCLSVAVICFAILDHGRS